MLNYTVKTFLILLTILLFQMTAFGSDALVLSGIYEYTVHPDQKPTLFSARYNFEVTISDCSWVITYENTAAFTNVDILNAKTTASCDGTNIYVVQFQNENTVKKVFATSYGTIKDQLPAAKAEIFTGEYPPPKEDTLQKIWFAFASSCILSGPSGKTKPLSSMDLAVFYNTNYSCDYYYTTNDNRPMARQIALISDGFRLVRNPKDGRLEKTSWPFPYNNGFTNGVGIWYQTTNDAGILVPAAFGFDGLAPKPGSLTSGELQRIFT